MKHRHQPACECLCADSRCICPGSHAFVLTALGCTRVMSRPLSCVVMTRVFARGVFGRNTAVSNAKHDEKRHKHGSLQRNRAHRVKTRNCLLGPYCVWRDFAFVRVCGKYPGLHHSRNPLTTFHCSLSEHLPPNKLEPQLLDMYPMKPTKSWESPMCGYGQHQGCRCASLHMRV